MSDMTRTLCMKITGGWEVTKFSHSFRCCYALYCSGDCGSCIVSMCSSDQKHRRILGSGFTALIMREIWKCMVHFACRVMFIFTHISSYITMSLWLDCSESFEHHCRTDVRFVLSGSNSSVCWRKGTMFRVKPRSNVSWCNITSAACRVRLLRCGSPLPPSPSSVLATT